VTPLTFGSLFSGIGGFDLGLERAGMRCLWQVEIDDYASRVLARHWPAVPRFRDVRECGAHDLVAVDVVCGGFLCQPFSVAGRRRGASDDRNLWPEMRRVVDELRPRWVFAENTPGLASLYLDTVLSDLEGLGYEVGTVEIPACSLDAPHIRQRLYVLAHADGGRAHVQHECSAGLAGAADLGGDGALRPVAYATRLLWGALERDEPLGVLRADGADADGGGQQERQERDGGAPAHSADGSARRPDPDGLCDVLPHPGAEGAGRGLELAGGAPEALRVVADSDGARQVEPRQHGGGSPQSGAQSRGDGGQWWGVEPPVGRVADGVPHRVDRLRCLGNAVVLQVIEVIGRAILRVEQGG